MRIKHVIGIAFTCMVFIFSCQAQSSTESHAGKNKQEQKIKPRHLTKAEFLSKVANYEKTPDKWEYLGSKPCIIDFYATWCGPCRKLAPILEEIAGEYAGKIDVYKIDVDKESELAGTFGIQSIPTLLMIPVKGEPKILQGAMPKDQLIKIVDEFLLEKK